MQSQLSKKCLVKAIPPPEASCLLGAVRILNARAGTVKTQDITQQSQTVKTTIQQLKHHKQGKRRFQPTALELCHSKLNDAFGGNVVL